MRLFALIFALVLGAVQVVFIAEYFKWLGAPWPVAPLGAVLLVGIPVVAELYGDEIMGRYPALVPLLAQSRSRLWQIVNALLVVAGAWAGLGWPWWQAGLLLAAVLAAPHIAGEVIRRMG